MMIVRWHFNAEVSGAGFGGCRPERWCRWKHDDHVSGFHIRCTRREESILRRAMAQMERRVSAEMVTPNTCWSPLFYRFPTGWQINLGRLELRWMYKP